MSRRVSVQEEDFDIGVELAALRRDRIDVGAVASLIGYVRGHSPGEPVSVSVLTLEHYPGMTERVIDTMIDDAAARFGVLDVRVVHRVGQLSPGEQIVLVAVAAAHRRAAFQACEFLMDGLKTQAPFWKKETTPEGDHWVDARTSDDEAMSRWSIS